MAACQLAQIFVCLLFVPTIPTCFFNFFYISLCYFPPRVELQQEYQVFLVVASMGCEGCGPYHRRRKVSGGGGGAEGTIARAKNFRPRPFLHDRGCCDLADKSFSMKVSQVA